MKCKRCKNEKEQIKAGKTKAGSQKYKCKVCGKVYTPKPKERNYSEEIKRQAIKVVYGRKQWKSSRKDTGNKQKYMLVLDKKIREKNRG